VKLPEAILFFSPLLPIFCSKGTQLSGAISAVGCPRFFRRQATVFVVYDVSGYQAGFRIFLPVESRWPHFCWLIRPRHAKQKHTVRVSGSQSPQGLMFSIKYQGRLAGWKRVINLHCFVRSCFRAFWGAGLDGVTNCIYIYIYANILFMYTYDIYMYILCTMYIYTHIYI